jgi:hypothetical protein
MTRHPDKDKQGVNISREKYELMRETIISILNAGGDSTFAELAAQVETQLEGRFDGSIRWYYTTVKLDLEARGVLERTGQGSPQRIRLTKTGR